MRTVLEQIDLPVAAAVLSVSDRRPMALEGRLGADPAMLAARPGSTVKPILAWLAAEAGELTSNQTHACDAAFDDAFPLLCRSWNPHLVGSASGFAPFKAPQVVVAVLVLGGGSRGTPAAPVATRILDGLAKESIIAR